MTKIEALREALNTVTNTEARETIEKMIAQLSKPRTPVSDEQKNARNAAVREKNAEARKALVEKVAPVLRKHLTSDITAKELFEVAKGELPEGFTAPKVQNILLREMKDELVKTEAKGKANTYRLA